MNMHNDSCSGVAVQMDKWMSVFTDGCFDAFWAEWPYTAVLVISWYNRYMGENLQGELQAGEIVKIDFMAGLPWVMSFTEWAEILMLKVAGTPLEFLPGCGTEPPDTSIGFSCSFSVSCTFHMQCVKKEKPCFRLWLFLRLLFKKSGLCFIQKSHHHDD